MELPVDALAAVTPAEVTRAADMFNTVKQLRMRISNVNDTALDKAFESHVFKVLEKLDSRLPAISDDRAKQVELVMTRHGLCDAAFQQLILLGQSISPELGYLLKEIRTAHSSFLAEIQDITQEIVSHIDNLTHELNESKTNCECRENEVIELTEVINTLDKVKIVLQTSFSYISIMITYVSIYSFLYIVSLGG